MTPIRIHTELGIVEAEAAARDGLTAHGFGVLTEIDVAATFKAKLAIDRPPLKILGACNPHLAHRALDVDPDAALVLPCNVVLETTSEGTTVTAADPHDILPNPALKELADDAANRLRAALDSIPTTTDRRTI